MVYCPPLDLTIPGFRNCQSQNNINLKSINCTEPRQQINHNLILNDTFIKRSSKKGVPFHLFFHFFSQKCLLCINCVQGIVRGTGDRSKKEMRQGRLPSKR